MLEIEGTGIVGCSSCAEGILEIPSGVTEIGTLAFVNCIGLTCIVIPDSVIKIGKEPFLDCTGLTNIIVDEENKCFSAKDGILYSKGKSLLHICPPGKIGEVVIPNSVTEITAKAFWGCSGLTSVEIPNSVAEIGEYAFG